jgi:hypothetical protein
VTEKGTRSRDALGQGPGPLYAAASVAVQNDMIVFGGHTGLASTNVVAVLKTCGSSILQLANPRSQLSQDWSEFLTSPMFAGLSDFQLVCSDGTSLPVHKVVLGTIHQSSIGSPHFSLT